MSKQLELNTGEVRVKCLTHKRHHENEGKFRPIDEIRFFIRVSRSGPDHMNIYTYCDECFRLDNFAVKKGVGDHPDPEIGDSWEEVGKERDIQVSRDFNKYMQGDRVIEV